MRGSFALRAQDDGERWVPPLRSRVRMTAVWDGEPRLCNPGQRMGAATRRMGLALLAASFGRGGGRWREAFATRYPTESEGDRL